ncbi:HEPN/Toprim-associated domain-containing protein [Vagococcus carniphilus]|uniref:HEPN/Toprim N-terminal domain-containing protein n=1 Tax=Vagococcus carniphilus TaxID=218144 RepID=A0A430ARV5_9ENTE|nr:HEPN/Toprim-associated domain-containing protein [Vagococcus carniphilus]QNN73276.1 hypothetical protein H9L18_01370 [Vagococcus carniphilus]RSU10786.1 hypothetical protein CBF28_12865 [Vagococcus carniphilus]
MGTIINLSINNLCIDWGKNYFYNAHSWLYESKEFQKKYDDYNYYEGGLAISEKLIDVKFRLNNLGYSLNEVESKFNHQLNIWSKNHDCILTFELLKSIVMNIDLDKITDRFLSEDWENRYNDNFYSWLANDIKANEDYISIKRKYLNDNEKNKDEFYDGLEDFILIKMDRYIILRLFCENESNLKYDLNWFCYDLIESGWVTIEDINYFDDKNFIIQHNKLYGRLQKHAVTAENILGSVTAMDQWLEYKGLNRNIEYIKESFTGNTTIINYTLPTFIRNIIHHPENERNTFSDEDLMSSINMMLKIIKY